MVIKIFSDSRFLPPNFSCHIMLPFWEQQKEVEDPDSDRFDKYIKEGKNIFQLSSLIESDIVVYPAPPTKDPRAFMEFQELTAPKPLAVFFNDDSDEVLTYRDNTLVFRTSFYKSTQRPTEFALPGWSMDYGAFKPRVWSKTPTVSFCGQVYPLDVRQAALNALGGDFRINKQFIPRDKFWAGWIASGRSKTYGQKVRQEFLQNLNNGDYVLCARGGGNFSYRLYETMAAGRIPLFINTDSVLPYDFIIDWKNMFPIVDKKDISHIGDILLGFHNSLSPEQFVLKQFEMRKVWEEWISPVGFFSNFHKHFSGRLG